VVTWLRKSRAREVGVRRLIYLGLLGRQPPSKRVTVVKKTCSGWFLDVGDHVTTEEAG